MSSSSSLQNHEKSTSSISEDQSHPEQPKHQEHHHLHGLISRIHIHGEGNELVTIGGHSYYRHELMSAFGGSLNPGVTTYPTSHMNPAPIGLCGFALTCFVLSLFNTQAMGITIPNAVVSLACFYGGAIQFLAGLFEFATGNTFALTVLVSYGAFWLSYATFFIESFGVGAAFKDTDQFQNAVGIFLLGWVVFTLLILLTTMKSTWEFFLIFVFLEVTFILLACGELTGKVGVTRAGGVTGLITAFIAWYNAFSGTATQFNSYIVPHTFPLTN
ncbi:mug86 [Candida metapsilosis]|uniref:Mug86 n=1 Tax=Candida metapsilosis TaxID=273372 RepID=A0A8H7ZIL5_9ASCO|nr:mug86 [Candida metapsilosis]